MNPLPWIYNIVYLLIIIGAIIGESLKQIPKWKKSEGQTNDDAISNYKNKVKDVYPNIRYILETDYIDETDDIKLYKFRWWIFIMILWASGAFIFKKNRTMKKLAIGNLIITILIAMFMGILVLRKKKETLIDELSGIKLR